MAKRDKTVQVDRVFHGDGCSRRNWYEVYYKYGYYWAKYELRGWKGYRETPGEVIRWILMDYFKKRY